MSFLKRLMRGGDLNKGTPEQERKKKASLARKKAKKAGTKTLKARPKKKAKANKVAKPTARPAPKKTPKVTKPTARPSSKKVTKPTARPKASGAGSKSKPTKADYGRTLNNTEKSANRKKGIGSEANAVAGRQTKVKKPKAKPVKKRNHPKEDLKLARGRLGGLSIMEALRQRLKKRKQNR